MTSPYGLEFMGKEWDRLGYAGGNPAMKPSAPAIDDEWNGFNSQVRPGYRQKNQRCRRCGKLQRGNGACRCAQPEWDTRTSESAYQAQVWHEAWATEALRVLKPGGYLLAFGGTRTSHRLACAVEDAGFEIRDRILVMGPAGVVIAEPHPTELAWVYGSG